MKPKYTVQELFSFMESEKPVRVTDIKGRVFSGRCWAYIDSFDPENDENDEPCLDVQDTILFLHEIEKIELAEDNNNE